MKIYPLSYKSKIQYLRNKVIEEYDMISGGFNVTLSENLIEEKSIVEKLKRSTKKQRQVILGNYTRDNPEYGKLLNESFKKYVSAFIHYNHIEQSKLLYIKKDAITFFNTPIKRTKFKKVEFRNVGTYTSFLSIDRLEFYYNSNTKAKMLKGLSLEDYSETIVEEIFELMRLNEFTKKRIIEDRLKELRNAYVNRELKDSYYRELSVYNAYKLRDSIDTQVVYNRHPLGNEDEFFEDIDITYNYVKIILPLLEIFL